MDSRSMNLYSTGMIIKATRDSENVSWFEFIIIILVESLSLYTIWGALFVIFYSLKSQISLLFLDTESPIVGIAFITLHVRVGMRRLGHDATISIEGPSNRDKKIARPEFEGH
ncbi:hypothetical protein BD779DRAFT_1527324 [Infundibulicybe gibba]|nr:hypothetical protein BD779DRAFT_1527324 [Infundibulicybe gibba]